MTLTMNGRAALPFPRALRFDGVLPGLPSLPTVRVAEQREAWKLPLRRSLGLRVPVHALLADSSGAWAWDPHDAHAAATRHASVQDWIKLNPGCDVRLWVSGQLVRSLGRDRTVADQDDESLRSHAKREFIERHGDTAASWALATWRNEAALGVCALSGIDLPALNQHAGKHAVRMQSVVPWWYHAFQEARRCVTALSQVQTGHVCVVEGRQLAWISTARGLLAEVRQTALAAASVEALQCELRVLAANMPASGMRPVVLGQGLEDGSRTGALDALVLGRLDGDQPPQWLRPSVTTDMH